MAQEWIETLAQDIKESNREAAQEYGRTQHFDGVVASKSKEFFLALTTCLKENVDALRSRLQGDPASADTHFDVIKGDEVKITRARFPWVDARVKHRDGMIVLDYARSLGVNGDSTQNRTTRVFQFRVAVDDSLFVEDAFLEPPVQYPKPDDLARHITEILFRVENSPAKSGQK